MALSKITLTLGKKVITLTSKEFEELKRDMRELDKDHHYYWHTSPWYDRWYSGGSIRNASSSYQNQTGASSWMAYAVPNGAASLGNLLIEPNNQDGTVTSEEPTPPPFNGSVLSTE